MDFAQTSERYLLDSRQIYTRCSSVSINDKNPNMKATLLQNIWNITNGATTTYKVCLTCV